MARRDGRGFTAENAAAATAARDDVKRAAKLVHDRRSTNDPATRAWHEAIAKAGEAIGRVYTSEFLAALDDLKQAPVDDTPVGRRRWARAAPRSIAIAIHFLEADLICFRSGYMKERLIPRLMRQPLAAADLARLRVVVLDVLDRRGGRDFRAFCRLAARVADAALLRQVETRLGAEDAALRERAGWMREAILRTRGGARGELRSGPSAGPAATTLSR